MQIVWAAVLAAFTNWLLLTASSQFLNRSTARWRMVLGAALGATLTAAAMIPGISITHTLWWRLLTLAVTALTAFGLDIKVVLLFSALHLSMGGMAAVDGPMVIGSLGICLACFATGNRGQLMKISIPHKDQTLQLTALRDTGNTLTDPVTGKSVLVVDAQTAEQLTGLTAEQLGDPVETMQNAPGLRLIPYRTIDSSGFLLAKQIDGISVGTRKGSVLVAFSPQKLGSKYQALTGGRLW